MQRKTHSFNSIMFSQNSLNKHQKRIMSICISTSIQFQFHKTIVDSLVCNIQISTKRVDWLGPTYPFTFFQWSKSFSISKEQQYTFRFYRPDKFEVQDHHFISILLFSMILQNNSIRKLNQKFRHLCSQSISLYSCHLWVDAVFLVVQDLSVWRYLIMIRPPISSFDAPSLCKTLYPFSVVVKSNRDWLSYKFYTKDQYSFPRIP